MEALEKSVRSIEKDGLVWGSSKLVAIGYGASSMLHAEMLPSMAYNP